MMGLLGHDIASGQRTIEPDHDAIVKVETLEDESDKAANSKPKRMAHFLSDLMKLALTWCDA